MDMMFFVQTGLAIAAIVVPLFCAVVWKLMAMIRTAQRDAMEGDKALHERVNRLRDDTAKESDLKRLSDRIDTSIQSVNSRLDKLLEIVMQKTK